MAVKLLYGFRLAIPEMGFRRKTCLKFSHHSNALVPKKPIPKAQDLAWPWLKSLWTPWMEIQVWKVNPVKGALFGSNFLWQETQKAAKH